MRGYGTGLFLLSPTPRIQPKRVRCRRISLFFGTTFLHYTHNLIENNFILLLRLIGLYFQYEWLRTGSTRALLVGSLALGANLLTRLTTILDIAGAGVFLLLILINRVPVRELFARLREYTRVAGPCNTVFFQIDRLYQYVRFGSFWNTYLSVATEPQRNLDPNLPVNFPWNTPLHPGALGPLITPEKSFWRQLICFFMFYARHFNWSGDYTGATGTIFI
jgi:hypothetical protein